MRRRASLLLVAWAALGGWAAGQLAQVDRQGRIQALDMGGDAQAIRTDLRIPRAGWSRLPGLADAKGMEVSTDGGTRTWRGTIDVEPGKPFRVEQTLSERDGAVVLAYRVTADATVKTEGVYFWLDVPIDAFGGGSCELLLGKRVTQSVTMPKERPKSRHFAGARADGATLAGVEGKPQLKIALSKPCHIAVQDNREWQNPTYSALIRFAEGSLAKGRTAQLEVRLKLSGEADHSPAKLTLDATRVRYRLDGFGGNYCFGIESPVTQFTLDNLRVAWARTEMTPPEWEPRNDNGDPGETDWAFLKSHDTPGSNLRREFLLAQQIQKRGIPYAIAIWHLPEWLYANPRTDRKRPNRRKIHPDKWPELLECIGSYLVHAKQQYGVEPDLFSFNEANIGVRVLLTAEEHRDSIKRLGAHFAKLGLKTRMLLADATGPRNTTAYAAPAAADPEAMKYVGAVGFHSWGGATPEQYAMWGDLAERLKLPLLVAELGVDAFAWNGQAYRSFQYGLREVRMYQEILLHARPQGTMQWEFTSDYGLAFAENGAGGKTTVVPHVRFWLIKHFCNLTPPKADALTTASAHPKVLFTAFAGKHEGRPVLTLHIANFGASRPADIGGLPPDVTRLRAVRTSRDEAYTELPAVAVAEGRLSTTLAAQSLLTVTTLPLE